MYIYIYIGFNFVFICHSGRVTIPFLMDEISHPVLYQSGKPGTILESNQASGVSKAHYA